MEFEFWWLLALPHYCVVALFVGGTWAGRSLTRSATSISGPVRKNPERPIRSQWLPNSVIDRSRVAAPFNGRGSSATGSGNVVVANSDPSVARSMVDVAEAAVLRGLRRQGTGPVYFNAYLTNFTLEDKITKAGIWVFGGGLQPASSATVCGPCR